MHIENNDSDMETLDLNYETEEFSYVLDDNDPRWYPGCEKQFLLLLNYTPLADYYSNIAKNISINHIFADSKDIATMNMVNFYLGRPSYIIEIICDDDICMTYRIQVGKVDEYSSLWTWQVIKQDPYLREQLAYKIGEQINVFEHEDLSYLPPTEIMWSLPYTEKWIVDIIKKYKQEFDKSVENSSMGLHEELHELENTIDKLEI